MTHSGANQYIQTINYNLQSSVMAYVRDYKQEINPAVFKQAYFVSTMSNDLALANPLDVIDND